MRGAITISRDYANQAMDMARYARCVGQMDPVDNDIGQIEAKGDFPERITDTVRAVHKNHIDGGRLDSSTWAGAIAPYNTISATFLESLRSISAFVKIAQGGMVQAPLKSLLFATTIGASAYVLGEGSARKLTRMSFENEVVDPFNASALVVVSRELLKMGQAADPLIDAELRAAVSAAVDGKFIAILDAAAASAASVGSTVDAVQQDIATALDGLDLGTASKLFIVANPDVVKRLSTFSMSTSAAGFANIDPVQGGSLCKIPIAPSDSCALTDVYILDASGLIGAIEGIEVEKSTNAALQLDDAPDSPPSASTVQVSMFQTNQVAIKADTYAGCTVVRANSVRKITGVQWAAFGNSP